MEFDLSPPVREKDRDCVEPQVQGRLLLPCCAVPMLTFLRLGQRSLSGARLERLFLRFEPDFRDKSGTDRPVFGLRFPLPSRTGKDALQCARADQGPHRLVVRTPAFQAGDTGSSPVGDTIGALGSFSGLFGLEGKGSIVRR